MSEVFSTEQPQLDAITNDNDPPYSRLFIVCGKNTTEEMLYSHFSPYGVIQYCKVVRDKANNEGKGVAYVKYEKASAAALAIEGMHGKPLSEDSPPLKVMIAESKGNKSKTPVAVKSHDDIPPRSRLFVICPKELSEAELGKLFEPYGGLEYCKIVKDKGSDEHKGVAYAKYDKSSTAARAMEEINKRHGETRVKVLIADPKKSYKHEAPTLPAATNPFASIVNPLGFPYGADFGLASLPAFGVSRQRLFVVCNKSASQESLSRLFGKFPGMEYLDVKKNKHSGESKGFAYVNYSTPQAALLAKEQLDGYEFPPGSFLKVLFAEPLGFKQGAASEHPSISAIRDSFAQMMTGASNMSFPVNYPPQLTQAFSHFRPVSTAPIGRALPPRQQQSQQHQQAQHHAPPPPQQQQQHQQPHHPKPQTTTTDEIPVSPLESPSTRVHRSPNSAESRELSAPTGEKAGKDRNVYPEGSRLYIVLSKPLPQYVLQDTFSRFGGLEYVHLQAGKSYGYAKYTTAATAQCAMNYLNDTILHGMKIKIQIALPPTDSRKRQRI